jgi:hypothetical protein
MAATINLAGGLGTYFLLALLRVNNYLATERTVRNQDGEALQTVTSSVPRD